MSDLDDRLQEQLDKIENGVPLDSALQGMPGGREELQPLVELAAAIRDVPRPEPAIAFSRTLGQRVSTEARARFRQPAPGGSPRWRLAPALVGLSLAVVGGIVLLGVLGLALAWPGSVRAATLMDVVGKVEVASSSTSANWHQVASGDKVYSGQRLRTGAGSSATLVYFEGSRTTVGASSDLTLTRLDGSWGNVLRLTLLQTAGETNHSVVPLRGKDSQFVVNTPAGSATVHGTIFDVEVDKLGGALFSVESGKVLVTNANQEVTLAAGQATHALVDSAPEAPAYQFTLNDRLTAVNGNVWNVSGVSFQVTQQTDVNGDPRAGADVLVRGRLVDGSKWVADSIEPASDGVSEFEFTGIVQEIGTDFWKINGITVTVNETTDIIGTIAISDPVKVTYTVLDGNRWLALEIELLNRPPKGQPTMTPTGTITVTATPGNCTGQETQPEALRLAKTYSVTYGAIMSWFCQRFGFGEIDLAYSLSQRYQMPVDDVFALRQSGLGWGEIRRRLAAGPTMTPTATITPTATLTPTATVTPTATITPTMTLTSTKGGIMCTDPTHQQPEAVRLAAKYKVTYAEIIGWFCQGFGFGEIDRAYALSAQTGTPVADYFGMKKFGLGWGEIKKLTPQAPGAPGAPGKPHPKKP